MIRMRVARLSPSYLPIVGGTETSVRNQVIFLKKHGVSSEILTLCDRKKWKSSRNLETKCIDDTRVLTWPSYPFGLLRIASTRMLNVHLFPANTFILNKHLNQFDLLHFHDVADLSFPLSCLSSRKPKIFTCDTLQEFGKFYQHPRHNFMRKLLIRSANLFHVFSNADVRILMNLGAQKEDIRVVPHGVDVEQFRPRTATLSRDFVHIVHVGRIERRKGAADLLRSIHIMKQQDRVSKRVVVSIAGEISDPGYYRELLAYKRRFQLDEVHFLGFVDDLPEWLRQADIFVCPSLLETLGIRQ